MCIICVQFQQEKLTLTEARRNFNEMRETMDSEHASEVDEMLLAEEQAAIADMMSVDPEPEQLDFLIYSICSILFTQMSTMIALFVVIRYYGNKI